MLIKKFNKKERFGVLAVLFFVFAIYLISNVSAIGITPARTTTDFSAGNEQTVSFSVVNTEHKAMNVAVFVQGELNQSISLSENHFYLSPSDESKRLNYTYHLPTSLTPGPHTADIVVLQLPEKAKDSDAYVGATVAIATQLAVNVPYPGKYVVADMNIINTEQNGESTFIIPVVNLGKLDIAHAQANIDIYNKLNQKVTSFNSADVPISSGDRVDIATKWIAAVPVGEYRAVATLVYDGETLKLEKQFNVGSIVLEVKNIQVNNFKLGEIAKFDIDVENKWSEQVLGAYAETQVFNSNNEVMADFKSPTYDFEPLSNQTMTSYWDTAGVKAGTYDSIIYLKYGEKSSQQNVKFKVSDNSIDAIGLGYVISETRASSGNGPIVTILITGLVILVIINLIWFMILRKKLKK